MPSAAFKKALASIEKKCANVIQDVDVAGKTERLTLDSPRLNYLYGGGVAIGRIHRYFGPESGGKSTICTYIASQFQKHLKEQLGLDKPYCVYLDFERSFDAEHARELGLSTDSDHFIFIRPDDLESAAIALEELIKTGEVATVIFDSESMSSTRTVMEDAMGKANFGSGAKIMKDFCNRFAILCANYKTTMFIISQERAQMAMMSHAIAVTGGYALKYAASTTNRVKKIEDLKEGSKLIGIHMLVRNYKNKTGIPNRQCEMDLHFKGGFDSNTEYVDFLKDFAEDDRLKPLCVASSAGYYKSEKYGWSYHGKASFMEVVLSGKLEGWEEIRKVVDEIIANPIASDANNENPEVSGESEAEKLAGKALTPAEETASDEDAADSPPEIEDNE